MEKKKIKRILLISDSSYIESVLNQILQNENKLEINLISKISAKEAPFNIDFTEHYNLIILNISYINNKIMEYLLSYLLNIKYDKIILLTTMEESKYGAIFINAGFDGYVEEHFPIAKIQEVILSIEINKKGPYFLETTKNEFLKRINLLKKIKKINLTRREKTIINLLASGRASKQIAKTLELSEATINVHRLNIKKKLGLKSAAELVNFAHNHINFQIDHLESL